MKWSHAYRGSASNTDAEIFNSFNSFKRLPRKDQLSDFYSPSEEQTNG